MAQIELRHLTKRFGPVVAVKDLNFVINDQEFVVLVGPSGCGKSTTLNLMAGLEEATEGEIVINGRIVNNLPPKDRDLAMVFQDYALYPHMRVYDNLAFGLRMRGTPRKEIERRVNEAAETLGIRTLLNRRPKELSGGQRQRVALGRAIVRQPQAFLMDEPLSNLDAKLRVQMRIEIRRLHQSLATTTVYVTHDQVEAMTMGDRIVVMRDGIAQQIDTPERVYRNPRNMFVAGFIGSPPINFMEGNLVNQNGSVHFVSEAVRLALTGDQARVARDRVGDRVCLGIRPTHIHPADWANGSSGDCTAVVRAEAIDLIGDESYLYLSTGETKLVALFPSERSPAADSDVAVAFDMTRVHLFDVKTQDTII
jgi:multiple sugar transport system ATP-binding protein